MKLSVVFEIIITKVSSLLKKKIEKRIYYIFSLMSFFKSSLQKPDMFRPVLSQIDLALSITVNCHPFPNLRMCERDLVWHRGNQFEMEFFEFFRKISSITNLHKKRTKDSI